MDAYDFYLQRRSGATLWTGAGEHHVVENDEPFTKRLARLKKETEHACDEMSKLFTRVEPEGRKKLNTAFGFVVRSLTKVADEMMAVHREQFDCTKKGE